ncbi:MAG: cytochrome C [Candidatus Latescibacterota bacterium]|nr:MAG: cytochrome C [Candidatus Latescibacterota bacterium]
MRFKSRISRWGAASIGMLAFLGCSADRKSPSGFRLPDGDPIAGLAVVQEMRCHACHRIEGHDELPAPIADPAVPIALGGTVAVLPTDGKLVTSIIHPSHQISSRYAHDMVKSGDLSRMGDYSETLTVRQMIDLVAFLHTVYEARVGEPREGADWRMTRRGG